MANEMRDRLVELFKKIEYTPYLGSPSISNLALQFTDYALYSICDDLIENGVVVPPMKLGQICFEPLGWRSEVDECRVSSITQKANGTFKIRLTNLRIKSVFEITPDKIGKTVFLTKDQAEQKLKEMRGE